MRSLQWRWMHILGNREHERATRKTLAKKSKSRVKCLGRWKPITCSTRGLVMFFYSRWRRIQTFNFSISDEKGVGIETKAQSNDNVERLIMKHRLL